MWLLTVCAKTMMNERGKHSLVILKILPANRCIYKYTRCGCILGNRRVSHDSDQVNLDHDVRRVDTNINETQT